jgi:hypothetical protein
MDMVISKGQGKLLDLMETDIIQIYVTGALNPAFLIPDGFTMPD